MENEIINNTSLSRFELSLDGSIAFIEYKLEGERITFLHTEVPPAHEGKGVAALLAKHALNFAKSNHLQMIILCPYLRVFVKRHPEYAN